MRTMSWRISLEILGRPPRQRPRERYRHSPDQPSRHQRKTVSGWTMIRLLRHWDHQRKNKIQNSRSQRQKHGRRVPLRSQHGDLMAQDDRFQQQRRASWKFAACAPAAGASCIAINESYSPIQITNESKPIKI